MDGALREEQKLVRQDESNPSRGDSTGKGLEHWFSVKSWAPPRPE